MPIIIEDMLHKIVECYIEDLVVKSEKEVRPLAWSLTNVWELWSCQLKMIWL